MDDTSDSTSVTDQTTPPAKPGPPAAATEQAEESAKPKLGLPSRRPDDQRGPPKGGFDPRGAMNRVTYAGWVPNYGHYEHPYAYGMDDMSGLDGEMPYCPEDVGQEFIPGRGPQVSEVCQRLMKTRFCRYGAHCKYGSKCFYAHSQDELRQRPPPPAGFARQMRQDYIDPQAFDPALMQFAPTMGMPSHVGQYPLTEVPYDANPYGCPVVPPQAGGNPTPPRVHPGGFRVPPGLNPGAYPVPPHLDSPSHQFNGGLADPRHSAPAGASNGQAPNDGTAAPQQQHVLPSPTNEMLASPFAVAERVFGQAGLKPEQIASILQAAQPVSYGD
ncbi:hypothetical protein FOZ60_007323 [Perkinsus olseni]|uniref:C3H1-type domain-containing protein n=2 Tax=Perkinsus olseni TaxID=32597 RepID=A0A7J6NM61_PEROL|nr:hypothetical protein FOZ60_007323 [Perkinsus olseni]